jgi:hypothetical protein
VAHRLLREGVARAPRAPEPELEMKRADCLDRLGWLVVAAFGLTSLGGLACASAPASRPVTTTSALTYAPDGTGVPVLAPTGARAACGHEMTPNIEFQPHRAQLPPAELTELDRWASCLNEPDLQHTTVVLLGKDEPNGPRGLFAARAQAVRHALILRGVDSRRLVIPPTKPTEDGRTYGPGAVRIEVTHLQEVRGYAAADRGPSRALLGR